MLLLEHYKRLVGPISHYGVFIAIPVYVLAILMVSNIRYRSSKNITTKGKSPFKIMVVATLILIIVVSKPEITFFIIGIAYTLLGLFEAIPGITKRLGSSRKESPPS